MNYRKLEQYSKVALFLLVSTIFLNEKAHAAGASMPWETPLEDIKKSVTGPVEKSNRHSLNSCYWPHSSIWRRGRGVKENAMGGIWIISNFCSNLFLRHMV